MINVHVLFRSILSIILEEKRKYIYKHNSGLLLLSCVWLQLHAITVNWGNNKRGSSSCWWKFLCKNLLFTTELRKYVLVLLTIIVHIFGFTVMCFLIQIPKWLVLPFFLYCSFSLLFILLLVDYNIVSLNYFINIF